MVSALMLAFSLTAHAQQPTVDPIIATGQAADRRAWSARATAQAAYGQATAQSIQATESAQATATAQSIQATEAARATAQAQAQATATAGAIQATHQALDTQATAQALHVQATRQALDSQATAQAYVTQATIGAAITQQEIQIAEHDRLTLERARAWQPVFVFAGLAALAIAVILGILIALRLTRRSSLPPIIDAQIIPDRPPELVLIEAQNGE